MDGIESMGFAQEIGRCLGGTADPGQFNYPMGFQGKFIAGLDDGIADGIMPTPGTERGNSAFIIASGIPEIIFWKLGMTETGSTGAHWAPP
jgi:hypothetical protein